MSEKNQIMTSIDGAHDRITWYYVLCYGYCLIWLYLTYYCYDRPEKLDNMVIGGGESEDDINSCECDVDNCCQWSLVVNLSILYDIIFVCKINYL